MCSPCHVILGYSRAYCYHVECHRFNFSPISQTFLAVTEYDFSPSVSSEKLRQSCIRQLLTARLKHGVLSRFFLELCELIAAYCVRECSIVTIQDFTHDVPSSNSESDSVVDLSRDAYAAYTRF